MKKNFWKYLNGVNKKNHYLSSKKWKIKRWEEVIFRIMFIILTIMAWVSAACAIIGLCYLIGFSESCGGKCISKVNNIEVWEH